MNEPSPHSRRPRYSGKNPRRFEDKYKEHQPEKYGADVEKVLAAGKTPAGSHRPIMVQEILDVLRPQPGDTAVDCTLGHGGHASELLTAVQPGGLLLAVDVDALELPKTEARLRNLGFPNESLLVRQTNYAGIAKVTGEYAPAGADVLLADLGLSSMQIDNPARGFTFKADGPLDMRMNPSRGRSAANLLDAVTEAELARILVENADEPAAERLSREILRAHAQGPLTTTTALARIVRAAIGDIGEAADQTVRRVFQALRIAVNDEFGALEAFLRVLPWCLKSGGRAAILTFHSGEDRRVKQAFKQGLREGVYREIADEVQRPSAEERQSNPRSIPAKLRWAIRA